MANPCWIWQSTKNTVFSKKHVSVKSAVKFCFGARIKVNDIDGLSDTD